MNGNASVSLLLLAVLFAFLQTTRTETLLTALIVGALGWALWTGGGDMETEEVKVLHDVATRPERVEVLPRRDAIGTAGSEAMDVRGPPLTVGLRHEHEQWRLQTRPQNKNGLVFLIEHPKYTEWLSRLAFLKRFDLAHWHALAHSFNHYHKVYAFVLSGKSHAPHAVPEWLDARNAVLATLYQGVFVVPDVLKHRTDILPGVERDAVMDEFRKLSLQHAATLKRYCKTHHPQWPFPGMGEHPSASDRPFDAMVQRRLP